MTRIIVTGTGRVAALALSLALRDTSAMVIGTGSVTIKTDDPELPTFNWPPVSSAPPRNSGRQVAQWKTERKGRRS